MMITGGSEAVIIIPMLGSGVAAKALSTLNENPSIASRPFDVNRDGFVMGEGAGALILESLDHAIKRNAPIIAEVAGGGLASDAFHMTGTHPDGEGAYLSMIAALEDANLKPSDIDYLNAHATSTPLGDISETKAIGTLFGEDAYRLNISSTKSMTGHLLGAAGAIEAIAAILSVKNDIVPPTINHFTDDPAFDPKLNFTFNKAQKRTVRAALSNTFGFGGHNASVIFKKYED
jgi:3-oxoacyl-[acyl-carrier-protein] synthase II